MQTLIVDDHVLFSSGLRLLLEASSSLADIACCTDGITALQLVRETPFDLILLDWNLGPATSGKDLIRDLKNALPRSRIVIVSGDCSPSLVRSAVEVGAVGYVSKDSTSAMLVDAITVVAHGGIYLPRNILAPDKLDYAAAGRSAGNGLRSIQEAFPQLTARHADVLELVGRGMQNKQIARALNISDGTVKQHLNAIFREMGVDNRTEAVYSLSKRGVRFG